MRMREKWSLLTLMLGLVMLSGVIGASRAHAEGTLAGTSISNQAVVTYQDSNGVDQPPVTSNLVTTTVAQAYGVDVFTANTPQNTLPGTIVYYPITVTNTGNGPDSYDLTAVGTEATWTRRIFADLNGNGAIDPGEPEVANTGVINPDASKSFVVEVTVPASAVDGTVDTMTVTATGDAPSDATGSAADTTRVIIGALLTGYKAAVPESIDPLAASNADRTVTYTISITNTGGADATNVVVEDTLPTSPPGVVLAGAATSTAGGTLEYFNQSTSAYEPFNGANLALYTRVRLTLASLAQSASGQLIFQVVVPQFSTPGTMRNTALLSADGVPPVPTNTTTTTLEQTAGVTITTAPGQTTVAGGTVAYTHTVTNTGNGPDVFDLTPSSVPAGWIAQLFHSDGITPINDTDGDGIPDTGTLGASADFTFIVSITAPPTATPGDYSVTVQARSSVDPSVSASATDTTTITENPTIPATKAAVTASPWPGGQVTYTISYSVTGSEASAVVITDPIPAGTTLVAGSITGGGTENGGIITWNLGTLPVGTTGSVEFVVRINDDVPIGTTIRNVATINFNNEAGVPQPPSVTPPVDVVVTQAPGVTLTPNNSGNAIAGTTMVYSHILTNTGNADDTYTLAVSSPNGWPYTLFLDVDGDGNLNTPPDTQITGPVAVSAGQSVNLLVRVQVPAGTPEGTQDTAVITATSQTDPLISASAVDTTRVVAATAPVLDLTKTVQVDTSAGPYTGPDGRTYNNSDGVARPGATLLYTVNYVNNGTDTATDVVITDRVPANTTLVPGSITGGGTVSNGIITWNIGTVAPTASGTVSFKVTID